MLYFKIPLETSLEYQLMQDLTAHSHEADDSHSGNCTSLPTYDHHTARGIHDSCSCQHWILQYF